MKAAKMSVKLTLNKSTVTNIESAELDKVRGGIPRTYQVISYCMVCPPDWTDWC